MKIMMSAVPYESFPLDGRKFKKSVTSRTTVNSAVYMSDYFKKYPEKTTHKKLRVEVITELGGKCECCSIDEFAFLSVHHKNDNGSDHRRELTNGNKYGCGTYRVLRDIKLRGFPKDEFGVLCYNCNNATQTQGICPHQNSK